MLRARRGEEAKRRSIMSGVILREKTPLRHRTLRYHPQPRTARPSDRTHGTSKRQG
ncbi:hypothetical protein GCM10007301_48710 [Azorhizobium oxalatiphilum]|uniref:Uncharacterized protein n=1 Tax=Azorhizobium oxalatiphilum TaxID=980631 RepID=A0A917CBG6_9HYPH|nr:hypothetical protein GCM10007301_48710 [Azorhizobium oxalatiphilum]